MEQQYGLQCYDPNMLLDTLKQAITLDSSLDKLKSCSYLPSGLSRSSFIFLSLLLQSQSDKALRAHCYSLYQTHSKEYLKWMTDAYFERSASFLPSLQQYLNFVDKEMKELASLGIRGLALSQLLSDYPNSMETWELVGLASLFEVTLALYEGTGRAKVILPMGTQRLRGTVGLVFCAKQAVWVEFNELPYQNLAQIMANLISDYKEVEIKRELTNFSDYQYAQLRTLALNIAENANILLNHSEICDFQLIFLHQLTKSYRKESISTAFPLGVKLECGHWTSVHSAPWLPASLPDCDICQQEISSYLDIERVLLPSETADLSRQGLCSACLQVSGNSWNCPQGHVVCFPCLYTAFVQQKPLCKFCSFYANDRQFLINLGTIQCTLCEKLLCISKFPPIHYEQTMICYDCYSSPTHFPLNSHSLTPTQQAYVIKAFFHCKACMKMVNLSKEFREAGCFCEVCVDCMDARMVEAENCEQCAKCRAAVRQESKDAVWMRVGRRIESRKAEKEAKMENERLEKPEQVKAAKERADRLKADLVVPVTEERKLEQMEAPSSVDDTKNERPAEVPAEGPKAEEVATAPVVPVEAEKPA